MGGGGSLPESLPVQLPCWTVTLLISPKPTPYEPDSSRLFPAKSPRGIVVLYGLPQGASWSRPGKSPSELPDIWCCSRSSGQSSGWGSSVLITTLMPAAGWNIQREKLLVSGRRSPPKAGACSCGLCNVMGLPSFGSTHILQCTYHGPSGAPAACHLSSDWHCTLSITWPWLVPTLVTSWRAALGGR